MGTTTAPDGASTAAVSGYVDWDFAKMTGRRFIPASPRVSAGEAADLVSELRDAAARSAGPVAETARMHAPEAAAPVLVVDRRGWLDANVDSLQSMLEPVIAKIASRPHVDPLGITASVGGKVTGGEAGALMAFLSSKVLGQYDLAPQGVPRLLLVAPNILATQTQLGVAAADFRLWVCLHEETHRVQFTAVPWLREHLIGSARALSTDLMPDADRLRTTVDRLARRLPEALRGGGGGIADVFATPEQREQIARVTAVMSLLEGHADVVMDDVGPRVVPSVLEIRHKFELRRQGTGTLDRLLRRLLGLEAKMRQYRDGAAFVRAVVDKVGVDGLNEVWTSPETLPLPAEILEPGSWVARVHGT